MKSTEELEPEIEPAVARLHEQLNKCERALRVRMSELKAAERHIAQLEGKLLRLKEYRSELKLLKEQKRVPPKIPGTHDRSGITCAISRS
jgi:hypothetical protein